jgi:hypothetical protein
MSSHTITSSGRKDVRINHLHTHLVTPNAMPLSGAPPGCLQSTTTLLGASA